MLSSLAFVCPCVENALGLTQMLINGRTWKNSKRINKAAQRTKSNESTSVQIASLCWLTSFSLILHTFICQLSTPRLLKSIAARACGGRGCGDGPKFRIKIIAHHNRRILPLPLRPLPERRQARHHRVDSRGVEEGDGVAVPALAVHHPVRRRAQRVVRPPLQHVPDVADQGTGELLPAGWGGNPCAVGAALHLEAAGLVVLCCEWDGWFCCWRWWC